MKPHINISFADPNEIEYLKYEWANSWVSLRKDHTLSMALYQYMIKWEAEMRASEYERIDGFGDNGTLHLCACLSAALQGRMFSYITDDTLC